ncbi:MAG: hypothetical protein ACRD0G_06825, partial [Acidimicrobiales bacterium]
MRRFDGARALIVLAAVVALLATACGARLSDEQLASLQSSGGAGNGLAAGQAGSGSSGGGGAGTGGGTATTAPG